MARGVFAAALIVPFSSIATAQHGGGSGGMGGMGGGMGGFIWWPLVWSVVLLSVLLIVGYGIYIHGRTPANEQTHTDTALSTLRSRYARGELSEEEFEERRRRLEE